MIRRSFTLILPLSGAGERDNRVLGRNRRMAAFGSQTRIGELLRSG
jgi:hypothetical protein